ncbi:MAG: NAD(P)-binding domain-containing protein [Salinibacterium sp.]|nr:NAD(P)-binding domain-containing protein [Salinibacterium sp.]
MRTSRRCLTSPGTRSKQTIGITGSGNIGGALALAFPRAGHHVVIANSQGLQTHPGAAHC